jgi:hypothetical protein
MRKSDIRQFTSWLGKRSYAARVERMGIERIREIARENGKKGGRPPKKERKPVLLTRGMKGCYVHFMDKNTENFFRSRMENTHPRRGGV